VPASKNSFFPLKLQCSEHRNVIYIYYPCRKRKSIITRLQFGLKNSVLWMMFAACGTGISLKLSTSPSALKKKVADSICQVSSFKHLVCTFIIRNEICRKFKVVADENIPFVSKTFNIHVRNRSNRTSTSKI
jgi:hypothetical protein